MTIIKNAPVEVLGTKIQEEFKKLDKFNYDVANYRVQNGMSPKLKGLYKLMGAYGACIEQVKNQADAINKEFQEIYLKEDNHD